jgi:hypothetical protein
VVQFDRSNSKRPSGQRAKPPDPRGMSGGGLFRVENARAKLVGILTDWDRRKNVMIAAHIAFVLASIKAHFPDLSNRIPDPKFLQIEIGKTIL